MVSPLVSKATLVGPANPTMPLQLTIHMKPRGLTQLQAEAQQALKGHAFISARQAIAAHAPTTQDASAIRGHLSAHPGVRVTGGSSDGFMVNASTSVADVERLLHTTINTYQLNGRTFYANATNPKLPSALAPLVQHIAGLDNALVLYPHAIGKPADIGSPGSTPFQPADIRTAYNVAPLISAGI
ncbi:MAG: hypothetical protein JO247_21815, partial [Chloroflexi bacterium]|nr:hypothetical protein [Chloroflexota bacterium]